MSTLLSAYYIGFCIYSLFSIIAMINFIPIYKRMGIVRSIMAILNAFAMNALWPMLFLNFFVNLFLPESEIDLHDLQDHLDRKHLTN